MALQGSLLEVNYEVESACGEDIDTVATYKLHLREPVDTSNLVQKMLAPGTVVQDRGDMGDYIKGTFEGTFKTKLALVGHESVTTGAITITALETLLGLVFGNAVTTATGSTLTGGTATVPTTTDSATLDPGDICFIGSLGDTKGEGQAYPIATHITTSLTLLMDMQGAPANGNVRYGGTTIYPNSAASASSVTTVRMQINSAAAQYLCHGCAPTAVSFSGFNPGDIPMVEITWTTAWWEYTNTTFPSAVASSTANPAATAGGSLVVNTIGTGTNSASTRRSYRSFTMDYTIGVQPLRGPGGYNAYQDIIGYCRGDDHCEITWTEDAEATTTTPTLPGFGTAGNRKHAMLTLSTADGKRVAFYYPSLRIANIPPQQVADGIFRYTIKATCGVGPTTTSALTKSKWRMHFA